MNPFTKGAKVRAILDTESIGSGAPIKKGAVLEVSRTVEEQAASLFNAVRPDGGEYALAKADFAPADATPAPLDPSKVKAGDTVTLRVDPPDRHPAFTVSGETHSLGGPTVYLGGWRVDDLPDYVTLTAHQPAPEPEPEWEPGLYAIDTPDLLNVTAVHDALLWPETPWRTLGGNAYGNAQVTNPRQLLVVEKSKLDVHELAIHNGLNDASVRRLLADIGLGGAR